MYRSWRCSLRAKGCGATLLVTTDDGDLLKARLDAKPAHPRALLTLLEGLSLWRGQPPLCVALSATDDFRAMDASTLFGDELWPAESPLVRFDIVHPVSRLVRIGGLGDFRQLRGGGRRGA
jgi:hypothetical protein